jgi:hypothetical protein
MPSLNIPHGESVVKVSVIDNGARIAGPLSFFFDPPILDHLQDDDEFGAPAWVFFIEHPVSKRRLLFDLGIRANPSECTPENLKYHKAFRLIPGKEIYDYLGDHGVEPNTIEAIIWRYTVHLVDTPP